MSLRKIEPKLVAYLDEKLKSNGIAQQAILDKEPRILFVEACRALVGVREKTGNNDGPMVELLQETIDGHDHESWCMSFIQSCVAYAEQKSGQASPLFPSEHCLTVWQKTPVGQRVRFVPLPGAIVIWKHGNTTNGHTGCVIGSDQMEFQAIEGNTTAGTDKNGKIIREGGGCYMTHRLMHGNGDMHVVGFLKPF